MAADIGRRVATVVMFAASIAINGAANALPLNGQTTGAISDRFDVYVVPAGYVFAIWGLIYLGLLAFVVDQAIAGERRQALFRRLGWLPALTAGFNGSWILAWHYELFPLSVALMVGLLLTLIGIHRRLRAGEAAGEIDRRARWTTRVPFSIYLGWITVATIANVATVLQWAGFDGFGIAGELWGAGVLLVGLGIATAFVVREKDAAYGLVIVWAYAGILVKESAVLPVAVVAGAGAIWVGALALLVLARRWRPAPVA
jgi:translocator protein